MRGLITTTEGVNLGGGIDHLIYDMCKTECQNKKIDSMRSSQYYSSSSTSNRFNPGAVNNSNFSSTSHSNPLINSNSISQKDVFPNSDPICLGCDSRSHEGGYSTCPVLNSRSGFSRTEKNAKGNYGLKLNSTNELLCIAFNIGNCYNGPTCRFSHKCAKCGDFRHGGAHHKSKSIPPHRRIEGGGSNFRRS